MNTKRRNDAQMKDGCRRGTAVANAIKNLWVIDKGTHRLINVSSW